MIILTNLFLFFVAILKFKLQTIKTVKILSIYMLLKRHVGDNIIHPPSSKPATGPTSQSSM